MKQQTKKTATTTTQRDYYAEAEKAVYIALRARHEKSGLQFLAELQNAWKNDSTARNATTIATQLHELEEQQHSHRKGAEHFQRVANHLKITAEERATAQSLANDFSAKATAEQTTINDLYEQLDTTYSDRADLVQVAVLKMLETERDPAPITATILASYGATTEEELNEKDHFQAQENANFRAVINAVGKAINHLATPEALNRTTTKAQQISAEEYNSFLTQYGVKTEDGTTLDGVKIPHTTKRTSASQCYITIEHRNTKTQKGFYKVTHYKTIAPYQYIDTYTDGEDGETDVAYLKTYNPIVDKYADVENIETLLDEANIEDVSRQIIVYYMHAIRYYSNKADIIKYICTNTKLSKATVYRRLEAVKTQLEPIAKKYKVIK